VTRGIASNGGLRLVKVGTNKKGVVYRVERVQN